MAKPWFHRKKRQLDWKKLKNLYKPLKLKIFVLYGTISAHEKVRRNGLNTGHEYAITICAHTGKILYESAGSKNNRVEWRYPAGKKEFIGVHNHPNDYAFSPKDLKAFMDTKSAKCLSVQGHSRVAYVLWRTERETKTLPLIVLEEFLDRIRNHPKIKDKDEREKSKIFVQEIAKQMRWTFAEGDVLHA
jgi:hypothetical protein